MVRLTDRRYMTEILLLRCKTPNTKKNISVVMSFFFYSVFSVQNKGGKAGIFWEKGKYHSIT